VAEKTRRQKPVVEILFTYLQIRPHCPLVKIITRYDATERKKQDDRGHVPIFLR
jgi:hypothetical protein